MTALIARPMPHRLSKGARNHFNVFEGIVRGNACMRWRLVKYCSTCDWATRLLHSICADPSPCDPIPFTASTPRVVPSLLLLLSHCTPLNTPSSKSFISSCNTGADSWSGQFGIAHKSKLRCAAIIASPNTRISRVTAIMHSSGNRHQAKAIPLLTHPAVLHAPLR